MKPYRVDGGENKFLYAALFCFGLAAVLAFLIVMGGCSLKSQQIANGSLHGADLGSTRYAESRGAVEANPVMQTGWPTRIALKTAMTAATIYVTAKLDQQGRKKLAKGLLYAVNGFLVVVVANNWRVAQ